MGENLFTQMLGIGQSEEFRVQQQLQQARQQPGGLQEGMEASIRQTEKMRTELVLMEEGAQAAGEGLADMTMALQAGEGEEWARGMIASLQKVALEAMFTQLALLAMQSAMGGTPTATGHGTSAGIGTTVTTGAGAGGRQHGGRVSRDHAYQVGEAGPELFVPDTAGNVISNSELSRRFRAPSSMAAPQVHVGGVQVIDQRKQGAPDIEAATDPFWLRADPGAGRDGQHGPGRHAREAHRDAAAGNCERIAPDGRPVAADFSYLTPSRVPDHA